MNKPTLANINKGERYHIYIGRANAHYGLKHSKWYNPFYLKKTEERGSTLEKFEEYFETRKDLIDDLHELEGKILGCYCFSSKTNQGAPCHGHILIKMFEKYILKK